MSKSRIGYHRLKFKCLECGLHFALFTWHKKEWFDTVRKGKIHCPECGLDNKVFFLGVEEQKGHIWQVYQADPTMALIHGESKIEEIPIDQLLMDDQ